MAFSLTYRNHSHIGSETNGHSIKAFIYIIKKILSQQKHDLRIYKGSYFSFNCQTFTSLQEPQPLEEEKASLP